MDKTSFLDAPRRSPHITHSITNSVQSVHPEFVMEPSDSQDRFGHEPTSFLEDTSDEESTGHAETRRADESLVVPIAIPNHLSSRKRKPANYLGGTAEQFHSRCYPRPISSVVEDHNRSAYEVEVDDHESKESSFDGSVDELPITPRPERVSTLNIRKNRLNHQRSHSLMANEHDDDSPTLGKPSSSKADRILGAYAVTLKALLNDDIEASQISPTIADQRQSKFSIDSRPRYRSLSAPAKKVSMIPPPINTSRHPLPENLVTTPYPFTQPHRRDFGRSPVTPSSAPLSTHPTDSILTLSIRRSNPHSRLRISTLLIPANSDFSTAVRSGTTSAREKHFAGLDFDDAHLFHQLRIKYNKLIGPYRFLAARSLSRILVSGSASQAADLGYGWLMHAPRSPRYLAARGLSDSFSEEKLMRQFCDPGVGKARFAWVGWAHRLACAAATAASAPGSPAMRMEVGVDMDTPASFARSRGSASGSRDRNSVMMRRVEHHEGLEFVVSWSAKRILLVLVSVILVAVAAVLLWVFLGPSSSSMSSSLRIADGLVVAEGHKHAGAADRVGTGLVLGICVLLVGLTSMGGWIGVSWLVL